MLQLSAKQPITRQICYTLNEARNFALHPTNDRYKNFMMRLNDCKYDLARVDIQNLFQNLKKTDIDQLCYDLIDIAISYEDKHPLAARTIYNALTDNPSVPQEIKLEAKSRSNAFCSSLTSTINIGEFFHYAELAAKAENRSATVAYHLAKTYECLNTEEGNSKAVQYYCIAITKGCEDAKAPLKRLLLALAGATVNGKSSGFNEQIMQLVGQAVFDIAKTSIEFTVEEAEKMAKFSLQCGDSDGAKKWQEYAKDQKLKPLFDEFVVLEPTNLVTASEIEFSLGMEYKNKKQPDLARKHLELVLDKQKDNPGLAGDAAVALAEISLDDSKCWRNFFDSEKYEAAAGSYYLRAIKCFGDAGKNPKCDATLDVYWELVHQKGAENAKLELGKLGISWGTIDGRNRSKIDLERQKNIPDLATFTEDL